MKQVVFGLMFGCLWLAAACGQPPRGIAENQMLATQKGDAKFRVETVARGLQIPWALAFLPDGNIIFTERPGRVRIIEAGELRAAPVFEVPDVEPSSESGLMDVSLHPNFAQNKHVYLAYAYRGDGKQVKVVRYLFDGKTLLEP